MSIEEPLVTSTHHAHGAPSGPLKIIYLHQYFTTPSMVGGTRSYEMARRLVAAGHLVHIITSDRERSGSVYETEESGIRVTWIPVKYSNRMGVLQRVRSFLQFALASGQIASKSGGDVIFATSTPLTIALPGVYAKLRRRVPMVFEVRDLWPETPIALGVLRDPVTKWLARQLERFAYRFSDRIVALSPGMRDGVEATGVEPSRISVIPNACDLDAFGEREESAKEFRRRHAWLQDKKLVIYAGTLGYANAVGYMARLASAVSQIDPDIRFLVIGSGREEATIRELAGELGVLDRSFFMLPGIEKSKIPTVFAAADLTTSFVRDVEAMWANSANKFFDSLAAGRPIAINHGGWQAELIDERDIGLVLDPRDVDASAAKLVAALHDDAWLTEAGARARKLAIERYSRDELAGQLEAVLLDAVSERTPHS